MSLTDLGTYVPTTNDLLAAYAPGSAFFASPRGALLAGPASAALPGPLEIAAPEALRRLDAAVAAGHERPIVVGALPFGSTSPPHLFLDVAPERATRPGHGAGGMPATAASPLSVTEWPGPAGYAEAVARALRRISLGELDKVVLARTLRVDYAEPVAVEALVRRLLGGNAHGYTYAVDLPEQRATRVLVGASPELLIAKSGTRVVSWPLAGSAPRSHDPALDRARAAALMTSDKDLREHEYVVRSVSQVLRKYCSTLNVPPRPALTATSNMWHLGSRITGELRTPEISSLELAAALHPTPAVCGWPVAPARDLIGELEPFDRGHYAGAVGWCDASGDGEWAVAIRCAEVSGCSVRLFAGAGIVAGSTPDGETEETALKFGTMLGALGIVPVAARP
ncbi:isochorismate synthase [Sphaerisporangium dianthi]|uniref:isochorismate synthase n=1 Tax=Sphaerisporangium dianthi TaxID=1436120 RepID=A0ABV9CVE5_9ACTN